MLQQEFTQGAIINTILLYIDKLSLQDDSSLTVTSSCFGDDSDSDSDTVGIQTATLWISSGHPAHNKRASILVEIHFTITLTMI